MTTKSRYSLAAAAVTVILGLSACASAEPGQGADDGAADTPSSSDGGSQGTATEQSAALDFVARTVDGGELSGASLAGEPAVLWFWAPWCTVCRGEAASVVEAAERHSDDVEFYGVAGLGEVEDMRDFVSDTGTDELTHVVDDDGAVWSGFGVVGQPAFAFVRPDGTFETVAGTLTDSDLDAYVEDELLGS